MLESGDFVLLPATPGFTMSGFQPARPTLIDPHLAATADDEVRHGRPDGDPDVRLVGGYFDFESPDAGLLVSLLPPIAHLRGMERLSTLVALVREEAVGRMPGRDLILGRLVEVLLVEALRATQGKESPPGILRGLADPRVTAA